MPFQKTSLLIVDDDGPIRRLMTVILAGAGYEVSSAEDGFSALKEIRKALPDIVLSDLYMPAMSGFEFLSIIRRRFPSIRVIAMSSAFGGAQIPAGVAADAFYEKGINVGSLLEIIELAARPDRVPRTLDGMPASPIWIQSNRHDPNGTASVTVSCPECLRSFPQFVEQPDELVQLAHCFHCASPIPYAVIHSGPPALQVLVSGIHPGRHDTAPSPGVMPRNTQA